MKKIFTVTKADVFSILTDCILTSVEGSHKGQRVIAYEDEFIKLINAENKVEHSSWDSAKDYVKYFQPKGEHLHRLINIRASHMTQFNGKPKWEPSYRSAYEAMKACNWYLQNFLARCRQGEILDGNYGKGLG